MSQRPITLQGGPWHGRTVRDSGAVVIRLTIAKKWHGQRPAVGAVAGTAHYEPNEERTAAFWSHNVWDGIIAGNYPA